MSTNCQSTVLVLITLIYIAVAASRSGRNDDRSAGHQNSRNIYVTADTFDHFNISYYDVQESGNDNVLPAPEPLKSSPSHQFQGDEEKHQNSYPEFYEQEECEDFHSNCAYFSTKGDCFNSTTSSWMTVNCRKSCKKCEEPCQDLKTECENWAKDGQCAQVYNAQYMALYCPKSCFTCRNQRIARKAKLEYNVRQLLP